MNGADTAWIIVATALVLFMTLPGLALFYGGLVRARNVLSVFMHCFSIACLMSILWLVAGYSIAFGPGESGFWGGLGKAFLNGVDAESLAGTLPEILFFAIMTTATALGDITEVSPTADLEIWSRFFRFILMLGAIVSTFLYGVLLHESIIGPSSEGVDVRLLNISVPLAIIYFAIGTFVEVLVGTIEDNRSSKT